MGPDLQLGLIWSRSVKIPQSEDESLTHMGAGWQAPGSGRKRKAHSAGLVYPT